MIKMRTFPEVLPVGLGEGCNELIQVLLPGRTLFGTGAPRKRRRLYYGF